MGICAHKKDQEEVPSLPPPSAKNHIFRHLIDMKKVRQVPLLSLAANPLFLKRIAAVKTLDNSNEPTSQIHSIEQKEDSA